MKHIHVNIKTIVLFSSLIFSSCQAPAAEELPQLAVEEIQVGAARTELYYPFLQGKSIAMMVNPTSMVEDQHLVDQLMGAGFQIKKIFAPEHGFRGTADAGEKISDGKDPATGIPINSLYGKKRKPSAEDLAGIDVVIFDIQDVGARFYTFISSMHYLMEACAEHDVDFLILDRPNPNGHYVDGPVLDTTLRSFVGMHPVPVVHGMTIGEYAQMINGEGWLPGGAKVNLKVIPCSNYTHQSTYLLPVKPSPNLPNNRAIYLYPSICYFEGTQFNLGRGTDQQFQVIGAPAPMQSEFSYTPESKPGAKYPKHEGKVCYGLDLSQLSLADLKAESRLNLSHLINLYQAYPDKDQFFLASNFFDKLAGNYNLREQLKTGKSESEIRQSWEPALANYKTMRKKYLLYEE